MTYFFPAEVILKLEKPPIKKLFLTGLWNKNSLRYEWFLFFNKSKTRFGYTAIRLLKSKYFTNFCIH